MHVCTEHKQTKHMRSLEVVRAPVTHMLKLAVILLIFSPPPLALCPAALGHHSDKDPCHLHAAVCVVWLPAVCGAPGSHL